MVGARGWGTQLLRRIGCLCIFLIVWFEKMSIAPGKSGVSVMVGARSSRLLTQGLGDPTPTKIGFVQEVVTILKTVAVMVIDPRVGGPNP